MMIQFLWTRINLKTDNLQGETAPGRAAMAYPADNADASATVAMRFIGPASKWRPCTAAGTGVKDLTVGSRRTPAFMPPFRCTGSDHGSAAGC
jgi:hypothetical protein